MFGDWLDTVNVFEGMDAMLELWFLAQGFPQFSEDRVFWESSQIHLADMCPVAERPSPPISPPPPPFSCSFSNVALCTS